MSNIDREIHFRDQERDMGVIVARTNGTNPRWVVVTNDDDGPPDELCPEAARSLGNLLIEAAAECERLNSGETGKAKVRRFRSAHGDGSETWEIFGDSVTYRERQYSAPSGMDVEEVLRHAAGGDMVEITEDK
jgi:hypothetical protein